MTPSTTARFLVWSDLHDEFWNEFALPKLDVPPDGVLIAGDTHVRGRHLEIPRRAAQKYGCPVVAIWGNHECYGSVWPELREQERHQLDVLRRQGHDVRVLHGETTVIAGVRIIGATLWTDLDLYPGLAGLARVTAGTIMNDYNMIRTGPSRRRTVEDMLAQHRQDKAALFEALARPHPGPTIVLTHHLPVRELVPREREGASERERALTASYASDLWSEIRQYDIHTWICGHTHEGDDWTGSGEHGPIRFVMNQRGYPHTRTGPNFDPARMLEVALPESDLYDFRLDTQKTR